ncbi:MAG: ABC transporter substrate-binding protein [Mycetocola sp.]
MTTAHPRRRRALIGSLALAGLTVLPLAACSGGAGGGGGELEALTFLKNSENTTTEPVLTALASGSCTAAEEALPLEFSSMPQADLDAQIQLLASQDGLPVAFSAGGNPAEGAKLAEQGVLLDFDKTLTDLGVRDKIVPGAVSTIEKLYGGGFNFLPFQYNIEGIFYNKTIFEENGWDEPTTWDELLTVADESQKAGYTAFSASGEQGWPLTRLVSSYLFRDLGPDALQKVADGEAKLTDPEYVAAAAAIADLGEKGYFGNNVTSLDIDSSYNEFLTGKASMIYMGSWLLGNIADESINTIGEENIGFMPFPAVEGGAGDINQFPANVGLPATFSSKAYNEEQVGGWLSCIANNYGNEAAEQGQITGFVSDVEVDRSEVAQAVADNIADSTDSVLWFEALFPAKASQVSSSNAALLVTGQLTPEEFMTLVQDALDNA